MSSTTGSNANNSKAPEEKNGYQIPKWAGKPPIGLHLDVMKEGKMIQKLMIDEKKCYFFGRNKDVCEFVIDHASCSRVHSVLLWHKHLNRSFLVDLNSTHGTFIGSLRLEPNKPQQVFVDSELKFGASTRTYIIRERPQANKHFPSILNNANNPNTSMNDSSVDDREDSFNQSLNLPESEAELDNLTEFNTAHNKRIAQLVDISASNSSLPSTIAGPALVKRKRKTVSFNEEEDIINPEDIDPSIGRFRNLVQTTIVVPNKKKRVSQPDLRSEGVVSEKRVRNTLKSDENSYDSSFEEQSSLYDDFDTFGGLSGTIATNLGIKSFNLAPDVDHTNLQSNEPSILQKQQQKHIEMIHRQYQQAYEQQHHHEQQTLLDGKKKYAKESWPGRHTAPVPGLQPALSSSPPHITKPSGPTSNPPPGPLTTTLGVSNQPAKRLII